MARPTAQADWLLDHLLNGAAYDPAPYQWLQTAEEKLLHDPTTLEALLELLILSGLGMAYAGSSRPASGGEHAIAHAYGATFALHGEEIAVTSLYLAKRQWQALDDPRLAPHKAALQAVMLPPQVMEKTLLAAGCPTTLEAIGWTQERFDEAVKKAPVIRPRYGFLDFIQTPRG